LGAWANGRPITTSQIRVRLILPARGNRACDSPVFLSLPVNSSCLTTIRVVGTDAPCSILNQESDVSPTNNIHAQIIGQPRCAEIVTTCMHASASSVHAARTARCLLRDAPLTGWWRAVDTASLGPVHRQVWGDQCPRGIYTQVLTISNEEYQNRLGTWLRRCVHNT